MKRALFCAAIAASIFAAACNKATAPVASPTAKTATGAAASAGLSSDTVVATYEDQRVTFGELDASLAKDIYELRRQALESMILRRLVEKEAAKAGKSEEEFLKEIASKAVVTISDEDLRKLYDEHKDAFKGRSFEDVKPMLKTGQEQKRQQEAIMAYVEDLKKRANVHITLPEPRVNVAAVGPSKGPADAPVTIVEFSDFQCPYCSKARETAEQAVTAYAGKVRLVFRNFPLPFHENAAKGAEASLCAEEQGKFWEMHDWMFTHQDQLAVESLKTAAKGLGIDSAKFDTCLDSGKNAAQVQESIKAGKAVGVSGTPAFFINGRLVSGALPFQQFKEKIDEELQQKPQ